MKILNIYLTEIYNFMDREGFFVDTNTKKQENIQIFIDFAKNLGYPEFGLSDGMALKDFSYLPNSDLVDFNDLKPDILMSLPQSVAKFIQHKLPDFNHQIYITLSIKNFSQRDVAPFVNSLSNYLMFLSDSKSSAIQRDFDFLDYCLRFMEKPTSFEMFLNYVKKSNSDGVVQWQILLSSLLDFAEDLEQVKKMAVQIILFTCEYNYEDFLQNSLQKVNLSNLIDPKIIKSKLSDSSSFIEISANFVFFSAREDDLRNIKTYENLKLLMPRLRVVFPEIYNVCFYEKEYYKRRVLIINYTPLGEVSKKTFNTIVSSLLNTKNQDLSVDGFNEKFLKPVESLIQLSGIFDKFYQNNQDKDIDIDKI